ncbi:hypothetical protein P153DRAFT_385582 [Dothidotthia symphoricarpi CBS 119687]|uniref:Uncharacterized protein n=1 Tax=Dothidotthia symphoricarpi CBS 119687 TaxID=1392245 RepID=A0A6A6ADN0_9PLEO|nr:uncharacterized protein P153DRAFT_385582 [Dothidotthia symphoricarpi CBS 119687]KAF2129373.1 hypothetical protein P153DRAFT_385582 [Dothidotthia symphoricarpi CBS 119687]
MDIRHEPPSQLSLSPYTQYIAKVERTITELEPLLEVLFPADKTTTNEPAVKKPAATKSTAPKKKAALKDITNVLKRKHEEEDSDSERTYESMTSKRVEATAASSRPRRR